MTTVLKTKLEKIVNRPAIPKTENPTLRIPYYTNANTQSHTTLG